jgi:NAD(P)-dependent dehydrogenase (short-subunit alcohol dehydrogenase family)
LSTTRNQTFLITGGASGIGRATALRLAAGGARVALADLDGEGASAVAKEITTAGGEALALTVDVTDPDANERMVAETIGRFGALDGAHLNAGIAAASSILDGAAETFDRVVAVNLRGVFLGLSAVGRALVEGGKGGAIVATASVAGLRGGAGMPSYYASKHGVVGLVKSAAAELAPHRIRVNAVCPGVIDTPLLGPLHKNEEVLGVMGAGHLLNRVGQPEEVAAVAAFLLSEESGFVTGAAWPVDGGMIATLGGGAGAADTETLEQALS